MGVAGEVGAQWPRVARFPARYPAVGVVHVEFLGLVPEETAPQTASGITRPKPRELVFPGLASWSSSAGTLNAASKLSHL